MKKIAFALAASIILTGTLTSCQKEQQLKMQAPKMTLAGFKKDISVAD